MRRASRAVIELADSMEAKSSMLECMKRLKQHGDFGDKQLYFKLYKIGWTSAS